jgi:hypothetical protein
MCGQRVLVTGDAGCYGFKIRHPKYFPDLLKELSPLHVVQVAHHAGRNYDFYNTLLKAGFAQQQEAAFLLLSHAVNDKSRPSNAFRLFIAQTRKQVDNVSLLFTSTPDASKVEDYDELVHPLVPRGSVKQAERDFRLAYYSQNATSGWVVERHVVAV